MTGTAQDVDRNWMLDTICQILGIACMVAIVACGLWKSWMPWDDCQAKKLAESTEYLESAIRHGIGSELEIEIWRDMAARAQERLKQLEAEADG